MRVIGDLADFPDYLSCPVMTIGVFDGVHGGHQVILSRLVERARARRGTSILLTFSPHPQKVIAPGGAPPLLQTEAQKEEMIRSQQVDILLRLPFTRKLSLFTPEEFAREVLHNHGIQEIHVGSNFRFGHRRSGDLELLASLGKGFQFTVEEIDPVLFRGTRISSSSIRALLREGRVALAKRLLGRPYQIRGIVVRGSRKGAGLGFPTANMDVENELIPANGVYATLAHLNGQIIHSVTNIGLRPTVDDEAPLAPVVEPHLLDFSQDLYGKPMQLDFCLRLRPEKKFAGIDELKQQIFKDVEATRRYLRRAAAKHEEV